ncbi:MAG TPA: cell division protein ZapE [Steroidobacteraceae bacterium]|nr:cell division protein ZapE [Steroidobacteraceae bacterium]
MSAPPPAVATLRAAYERELAARGYRADEAQLKALAELEGLRRQILARPKRGTLARLLGRRARGGAGVAEGPGGGVYLWGAVGRGKTWLMDLFCASLPGEARRLHFHHFMREVHALLGRLRQRRDPLPVVAGALAARSTVLCLDELFVADIADAMILGGLFEALLCADVALVITSNTAPGQLYRDGLQRARFLPAIELLERKLRIVELDGAVDYRLRELKRRSIYLSSQSPDTPARLAALFEALATRGSQSRRDLLIQGRSLHAFRRSGEVVWFSFATLCEGARSQNDYVELAEDFHTVLLSEVPVFAEPQQEDAARRFVALVDELYDQGVKLIVSAAASPETLYRGERLRETFQRTVSRLTEMQSEAYLARPHGRGVVVA